jgi:hypothetical protein
LTATPARGAGAAQQRHPDGCDPPKRRGAFALRSLVAKAARRPLSIAATPGVARTDRGAATPHSEQGCERSYSAIGRTSSNPPHRAHA